MLLNFTDVFSSYDPQKVNIITHQMEDKLWNDGVLGDSTYDQLNKTLIFLLGIRLTLRSGEHRMLRRNMFRFGIGENGSNFFEFTEFVSKSNQGGLNQPKKLPKKIRVYEMDDSQRCLLKYFKKYLDATASHTIEALYLRVKKDGTGFINAPLGQHILESKFKEILASGGFHGRYTLHSMRRTGATRMFSANLPKQIIKMHTGHSSDAVEQYIEVGDGQLQSAAHALTGEKPKRELKQPVMLDKPEEKCAVQKCVKSGKSKKMKFSFSFSMHSSGDESE
jgi:hypothetical protein